MHRRWPIKTTQKYGFFVVCTKHNKHRFATQQEAEDFIDYLIDERGHRPVTD